MAIDVTKENFDKEVMQSAVPVLVDFWAEWCGPCRVMSPIVDEISHEMGENKLKVVKVNVDQANELAQQYGVMSIPSFKLFKSGQVVTEFVGSRSKDSVLSTISEFLS